MAVVRWEPLLPRLLKHWPWPEEELLEWAENEDGLNLYETEGEVVVEAYVPGVSEKEIEISLDNNVITIKAEHKETEEEKKKKKVVYRRAARAAYLYTATIPCPVETDKAKAELKNGVLKITLPKVEEAKPKKIPVKAG